MSFGNVTGQQNGRKIKGKKKAYGMVNTLTGNIAVHLFNISKAGRQRKK